MAKAKSHFDRYREYIDISKEAKKAAEHHLALHLQEWAQKNPFVVALMVLATGLGVLAYVSGVQG